MDNYAGEKRRQAIQALIRLGSQALNAEDIKSVEDYFDLLEARLNAVFDLLATDNLYSDKTNAAWQLLSETLGRMESTDEPFTQ